MAKSIRVKFVCSGSAGGFLYPICILVSNISKEHLPKHEFRVIEIEGLTINGNIDPRSKESGYLCLMRSNVSQRCFFEWFHERVTCPTVIRIRERLNPMCTVQPQEKEVPADERFVLWGDSDIPYLQEMMCPERIIASQLLGLNFGKIGAKITESSQPLDLGVFFKILRLCGKNMTSVDTVKPLTLFVNTIFKQLRDDKELLLPSLKENALKNLVITAPELINKAFSEKSIVDSFVSSGMLDKMHKRCPDIYGLVDTFKVNWGKVEGGKTWFMNVLPEVISEMYSEGEISEKFYDNLQFPKDYDEKGNVWLLKNNADHLSRSKVLYHPVLVQKIKDEIRMIEESKAMKASSEFDDAIAIWEHNIDCENIVLNLISNKLGPSINKQDITIDMVNLDLLDNKKLLVKHLSAFYRCRVQEDLMDKIKLLSKGTMLKVAQNEVDKATNGKFLIQLCNDVKGFPVISKLPVLDINTSTSEPVTEPDILDTSIERVAIDVQCVTEEYINKLNNVCQYINEHSYMNACTSMENDMSNFKLEYEMLALKIGQRLPQYLKQRLPFKKVELFPNKHWVWTSFKMKLNIISVTMLVARHVVEHELLKFRDKDKELLSLASNFKSIDVSSDGDGDKGNYLLLDKKYLYLFFLD